MAVNDVTWYQQHREMKVSLCKLCSFLGRKKRERKKKGRQAIWRVGSRCTICQIAFWSLHSVGEKYCRAVEQLESLNQGCTGLQFRFGEEKKRQITMFDASCNDSHTHLLQCQDRQAVLASFSSLFQFQTHGLYQFVSVILISSKRQKRKDSFSLQQPNGYMDSAPCREHFDTVLSASMNMSKS